MRWCGRHREVRVDDRTRQDQADPEVRARIQASFDRQGLMTHLGARLGAVEPGEVHVLLPARDEVTQQYGYFHGGATSAIADTAGGYAAFTLFPPDTAVLTVEFKINLLAPALGDHLEAVGTVLKPGRTLTITRLDVFAVQADRRTLVAAGQQTLIQVDPRPHR
jgi:uncharacterized protein (TIGR00369 family)